MTKTYINEPMSDVEQNRVKREDKFWDGPKLIALLAVTLGSALLLLWAMANQHVGPAFHS